MKWTFCQLDSFSGGLHIFFTGAKNKKNLSVFFFIILKYYYFHEEGISHPFLAGDVKKKRDLFYSLLLKNKSKTHRSGLLSDWLTFQSTQLRSFLRNTTGSAHFFFETTANFHSGYSWGKDCSLAACSFSPPSILLGLGFLFAFFIQTVVV